MKSVSTILLCSGFTVVASSLLVLSACSDDALTSNKDDSRVIRFNVSSVADLSSSSQLTRSDAQDKRVSPLNGGEVQLFLVPSVENGINLNTDLSTRSELIDSSNISSFGVFAGYTSESTDKNYIPNYISNAEISRSSGWAPHDEYLWPGDGSLHFNAYSPFFSQTGESGIMALNNQPGNLSVDFKVAHDVADQQELLYCTPVDASSSPCNLSFNHALTAVRLAAGSEMVPCTVKSVSISGIPSTGIFNLESAEWSDLDNSSQFSVEPNINLSAAEGSSFVATGSPITNEGETFLLLPGTLPEEATVSITVEVNGKETTLTSSIAGQTWRKGTTVTYKISANPEADSLILDVTGSFAAVYTGSKLNFEVKSSYNNGTEDTPVEWYAEFVDDKGNVIDRPEWVLSITDSGTGDYTGEVITQMQDIIFENMSSQTKTLQNEADINSSSGFNPYNLSSSSGGVSEEETANTYIINAPGSYSIPLVYGNAIKNGTTNSAAYTASTSHSNTLKGFTNHLGKPITSPYIYLNNGCTPEDAVLVWEDELNLIRNVSLSDDGHAITFDVLHNTIRQGNAIVAVRDADGKIMWSWQLWVTDFRAATGARDVSVSGKNYGIMTENLGYVAGGDVTRFPECSVKVRFTQKGLPDNLEPLSKTVELTQTGTVISTPDCNTFYQWGRKDPMMSTVKQWYNADHTEITNLPTMEASSFATSSLVDEFILNPSVFFTSQHTTGSETPYPYINLWNVNYSSANVKSIYDPSPVGFVVPYNQPLSDFAKNPALYPIRFVETDGTEKAGYYVTIPSGDEIYFPHFGYRASTTAALATGDMGFYWVSRALNVRNAGVIDFSMNPSGNPVVSSTTDPLFHALSIRPIKE